MMKNRSLLKETGGLLAASLLFASTFNASAGPIEAPSKTIVENPKPGNPLSFYDGRLVFDVEERLRYEFRENNFDFSDTTDPSTDEHILLQRFRLGMKIKPTDWLTFYSQLQSSIEASRRVNIPGMAGAEGDVAVDFRQLYFEFANYKEFPIGLKLGRQIMVYGDERLIGSFDWNNIGRTFDAVKVRYETEGLWLDLFSSSLVTVNRATENRKSFNFSDLFNWDEANRSLVFSGAYASTTMVPKISLDAYLLILNMKQGTNTQFLTPPPAGAGLYGLAAGGQGGVITKRTDFVTLGTRIKSNPKDWNGFEFDGEFAYQIGKVQGLDLEAFGMHAGAGYNFDLPWSPRFYAEYNYGSGDTSATDGNCTTFQNLFPTNHKFYGFMDLFSLENIHNAAFSTRIKPIDTVSLQLDYHLFWLATTDDAWYRANGLTRVRPITPAADNFVGSELDLVARWKPCDAFAFETGYCHFFAGDYVEDTKVPGTSADDADFVYAQVTLKF